MHGSDSPMPTFDDVYERMCFVTQVGTRTELADAVEIRPSDLSEAARRGEVSLVWLITLMEKYRASPVWLLSGEGETYLPPKLSAAQKRALLREIIARLEDMAKQWRHSPLLEEERKLQELRDKKVYLSAASDAEAEQAE